jgi:hypothetical protein
MQESSAQASVITRDEGTANPQAAGSVSPALREHDND